MHSHKLEKSQGSINLTKAALMQSFKFSLNNQIAMHSCYRKIIRREFSSSENRFSKGRVLIHVYNLRKCKEKSPTASFWKNVLYNFFTLFLPFKKRILSDNIQRPKQDRNSSRENQQKFVLTKHFSWKQTDNRDGVDSKTAFKKFPQIQNVCIKF